MITEHGRPLSWEFEKKYCKNCSFSARTKLLLEVSRDDITGEDIQEFLSRAIQLANTTTNITATISGEFTIVVQCTTIAIEAIYNVIFYIFKL